MSQEIELVTFLGDSFPSLRGGDAPRRTESLGLYAASVWAAGPQGMSARGIPIPEPVHATLAPTATRVQQARRGGTTFLCHVRRGLGDDGGFLQFVRGLATVYQQATSGAIQVGALQQARAAASAGLQVAAASGAYAMPGAAAPPAAPPAPAAPTRLEDLTEVGGFEIEKLLGEGGMGKVFKAVQRSLDRTVALKVLNPGLSEDEEYIERFALEAKAAARLTHPNIVGVIEQGTCARTGVRFIAFEFIDGTSAERLVTERGKLPDREALDVCLGVAEALHCAEKNGIVHRDVKPDNILITRDGVPKLADLGLAKRQDDANAMTIVGVVMGTPQYIAPEQALGERDIDVRADLYALGITLFRLVTGEFPFESETALGIITKHLNEDVKDPRSVNPRVGEPVARLVAGLCARDRERRYRSARDAADDIKRALEGKPVQGTGAEPEDPVAVALSLSSSAELVQPPLPQEEAPADLDPAERALWQFARTGAPKLLEEAERLYAERARAAHPVQAATGTAGMGKVFLLRGDGIRAEQLARAALEKDPSNRLGAEVLVRVERGEPARARFVAELAQIGALLAANRAPDAIRVANRFRSENPAEPHPYIAMAVLAKLKGDDKSFEAALRRAWSLYPSKRYGELPLGGELDLRAADVLVGFGRQALKSNKLDLMRLTYEQTEDPSNVIAGALRLGIATARVALAQPDLPVARKRRLLFAIARGLSGLQFYDHASETLSLVAGLSPEPNEARAIDAERRSIANLKRNKGKPGIEPQAGKYQCLTTRAMSEQLRGRLEAISRDRGQREGELHEFGGEISELAQRDPQVKAAIRAAAQALAVADPFEKVDALERELAELDAEKARLSNEAAQAKGKKSGGGGFLSMIKDAAGAAADAAGRAARQTQLKLKEGQVRAQHGQALKALGIEVARKLSRHDFQHPQLAEFAQRARRVTAFTDYYEQEERQAREGLAMLMQ